MFLTALLYGLFVPLVDHGVVQICVAAGTLADDTNDVEMGILVVMPVKL